MPGTAGTSLPVSWSAFMRVFTGANYSSTFLPLSGEGVWMWNDLPYALPSRLPKHTLDVMIAAKPFPRKLQPVLLFVHGGAWQRGDKRWGLNLYWNVGVAAANAGIVGAVCNYRLAPDVKHPDNAVDVARALVWLRDNVRQYGGDPDAIFLCGHSAGAHLAMHVAATGARTLLREAGMHSGGDAPSAPSTSPDVDEVEIAGVIGLCGVYNVSRLGKSPFGESLVHPVFSADPAVWRRASPVYNVPSHSSLHRTPVLLLNAEHDFHLEEDAEELELALAVHAPPHTKHWFQERRAGVASALQACVPPLPAIAHHRAGRSASTEARAASVYDGMLDSAEHDGAPLSEPAPELGTGVRWAPGPGLSPNVFRGVIAGTNHMTLVGGMGHAADAASLLVTRFVHEWSALRSHAAAARPLH